MGRPMVQVYKIQDSYAEPMASLSRYNSPSKPYAVATGQTLTCKTYASTPPSADQTPRRNSTYNIESNATIQRRHWYHCSKPPKH